MLAISQQGAGLLQGEGRTATTGFDRQVHTTGDGLHAPLLRAEVLEECGAASDKRRALFHSIMVEDAILDADKERIPRRDLPYFDEQPDDVGVIEGIMSSGGPFRVAFLDTNQFGPHAMIIMLFGFAFITGGILYLLGQM
jgi:hypothetical protein